MADSATPPEHVSGSTPRWRRADVWVLVVASIVVLTWIGVLALRLPFPLELEWMEGGVLHQANRFRLGLPIYPRPSADFVPFLYTPLYPIVLASLGTVFEIDVWLGRSVSVAATIATGWGLWYAVAREGKPLAHRFAVVGLFASGYVFGFRWLDLVRPDALFLALTVWGLAVLRDAWGDHRKAVLAGVLMALAFWTKQTAAVLIVASGVGALWVAPRQAWSYAVTIALLAGGGVIWGNTVTQGQLWHYIYELHQHHAFNRERFTTKTWGMFVHALPWTLTIVAVGLVELARPWLHERRRLDPRAASQRRVRLRAHRGAIYWGWIAAAALLVSALGYSTQWAEPNAFLPGIVFLSLAAVVLLPASGRVASLGWGLAILQMGFGTLVEPLYQPIQNDGWRRGFTRSYAWQRFDRSIPSKAARSRAQRLRAHLEASRVQVFAWSRPWWSTLAGGEGHVGTMGLSDLQTEDQRRIQQEILRRLEARTYGELWFEGEPPGWMARGLLGYRVDARYAGDARVRPYAGYMSEAGMVTPYRADQVRWRPLTPREPPPNGRVLADFEDGTLQGFEVVGTAFGRRVVRGVAGSLPAVGPYGGEYLLSSAGARGQLELTGEARSPSFELPSSGAVTLWVGTSANRTGLSVEIVAVDRSAEGALDGVVGTVDGDVHVLEIPPTRWTLVPVRWEIPASWARRTVRLRLRDDSPKSALWVDDLWLMEG